MRRFLVLLLAVAACGDDGSHQLPDAPVPPDAPIDAAPDSPVTLTITRDGQPIQGVEVYFLNPDDSLVAKVATNENGVASAIVLPGASVTAVDPFPREATKGAPAPEKLLRTFAGVKPGDALQLTDHDEVGGEPMRVELPIHFSADAYEVHSTCGSTYMMDSPGSAFTPFAMIYLDTCETTADFVIEALSDGTKIGWFHKAEVAVSHGATIDLTAESYQDSVPEVTFSLTNVPAELWGADYDAWLLAGRGKVWQLEYLPLDVVKGTATDTFQRAPVPNTTAMFKTFLWSSSTPTIHELHTWRPPAATTSIDAGARLLPEYSAGPELDSATRTVDWSVTATGQTPDLVLAGIYVESNDTPAWYEWEIVAPYGDSSLTFPKLPDGVLPFVADDSAYVDVYELTTAKVPGGYDAVRAKMLDTLRGQGDFTDVATGPSGDAAFATYQLALAQAKTKAGKVRAQAVAAERARRAAHRR